MTVTTQHISHTNPLTVKAIPAYAIFNESYHIPYVGYREEEVVACIDYFDADHTLKRFRGDIVSAVAALEEWGLAEHSFVWLPCRGTMVLLRSDGNGWSSERPFPRSGSFPHDFQFRETVLARGEIIAAAGLHRAFKCDKDAFIDSLYLEHVDGGYRLWRKTQLSPVASLPFSDVYEIFAGDVAVHLSANGQDVAIVRMPSSMFNPDMTFNAAGKVARDLCFDRLLWVVVNILRADRDPQTDTFQNACTAFLCGASKKCDAENMKSIVASSPPNGHEVDPTIFTAYLSNTLPTMEVTYA